MGREVRGRFRLGDTCTSMGDSCPCMAKTHYNIVINLQLKNILIKKKRKQVSRKWLLRITKEFFTSQGFLKIQ